MPGAGSLSRRRATRWEGPEGWPRQMEKCAAGRCSTLRRTSLVVTIRDGFCDCMRRHHNTMGDVRQSGVGQAYLHSRCSTSWRSATWKDHWFTLTVSKTLERAEKSTESNQIKRLRLGWQREPHSPVKERQPEFPFSKSMSWSSPQQYLVRFQLALIVVQNHICYSGLTTLRCLRGLGNFSEARWPIASPGTCWGHMWCILGMFGSSVTVQMLWTLVGILPWESEQSVCGPFGKTTAQWEDPFLGRHGGTKCPLSCI